MSAVQPLCIEANRAYQATRAYCTPPDFPEWDERRTTCDYGLVHLGLTITKRAIFYAIIHLLLPSEAVLVLQCRKVFVVQVEQAAEAEVHRHLQALEHSRAAFPSPSPASNLRYWHYLQQLTEALAGRPPKGFRFAVTKAADEQAPPCLGEQIWNKAAYEGELDELIDLCEQWAGHPVIDAHKGMGVCALIIAARNGHEACVRVLIAAKANVAYANSNNDRTALHCASLCGHASICRVLIDEGASLTDIDCNGQTPLELAKEQGNAECVAILEAPTVVAAAAEAAAAAAAYAFVDEHIPTTRGFRFAVTKAADEQAPPGLDWQIYDASKKGKLDQLLGLCEQWAGHPAINAYISENGWNALLVAGNNEHEACVRVLIAAKANVAYATRRGTTALHVAAFNGHASTCRVLVDEGASLTAANRDGKTPLEFAKAQGHAECVAILEAAGAVLPPAVAAAYAFVDEHIATTRGFRFAVTKAADEGAPRDLDKQIYDAAEKGNLDELLGLCQKWAGHPVIDAYKDMGVCALIIAARNGYVACVRVLIAAKAELAYADKYGWTALHCAAGNGQASICRVLIDEGASLTAVNRDGKTPLESAKHAECVAILEARAAAAAAACVFVDEHIATTRGFRFAVTKAADEEAPPGLGKQIYDAAEKGKLDELLDLCQQWAGHPAIDAYKDEYYSNTLIVAAVNGHEACVRVLIAAKANVAYVTDNDGWTALHCAAGNGHASICRVLVDEGASLTAVNRDGKTPLELAKAQGHAECVAILEAAGAVLPPAVAAAYAFVDEHIATTSEQCAQRQQPR